MSATIAASALIRLGDAVATAAPRLSVASVAAWVAALSEPMRSSGITTPRRVAAFLGQVSVESAGFTQLSENLNYSAERLCQVWPSHFVDDRALVDDCTRSPNVLACTVYANRMGNGNFASGDGWRFRGGGLIQLTGRINYQAFGKAIGKTAEEAADYVRTPAGAAASACWFWTKPRLPSFNAMADAWRLTDITRAVNGGENGLLDRVRLSNAILVALG